MPFGVDLAVSWYVTEPFYFSCVWGVDALEISLGKCHLAPIPKLGFVVYINWIKAKVRPMSMCSYTTIWMHVFIQLPGHWIWILAFLSNDLLMPVCGPTDERTRPESYSIGMLMTDLNGLRAHVVGVAWVTHFTIARRILRFHGTDISGRKWSRA